MWPVILTIEEFLSVEELAEVQVVVEEATFQDGAVSAGGGNLKVKNNEEMAPDTGYVEVVRTIERVIRDSKELNYTVFPRAITKAIINRYEKGQRYGEHIDSPVIGFMSQQGAFGNFGQNYVRSDFSMTVFLSEPEDYEGGVLSFRSPWGLQEYKLPAGDAVVYPTGMPHEVTPVTSGVRVGAILWLQSMIADAEQRRLVSDITRLAQSLISKDPESQDAHVARDLASTALRLNAQI